MTRVLSIVLPLAAVVVVIVLVGLFTRTPRFASLRHGIERQVRTVTEPKPEVEIDLEAVLAPGA